MGYKILGFLVWHGAKLVLRRKYGSTYVPKPVLAGAAAATLAGAGLAAAAAKRAAQNG